MMLGIIAYGSLINPLETKEMENPPARILPIKLSTFKRSFNQRPAWRDGAGQYSAVLNAQSSEPDWFNAVCYCFENFEFSTLDSRERGYTRTAVQADKISVYQGDSLPELEGVFIYLGKGEYQSNLLLPNPDYLKICLRGAKDWGEDFYCDFLNTTHINNRLSLREYLRSSAETGD